MFLSEVSQGCSHNYYNETVFSVKQLYNVLHRCWMQILLQLHAVNICLPHCLFVIPHIYWLGSCLGSYHFLPGRGKDFWGWSRVGGKIFYKVNEGVRIFSWVQEGIFFFHLWHDFLYFPYQQIFLKTSYAGPLTFLSIHYAYIHTCIYFIYIIGSWLYYSRGRLRYLTPRQGARVFFARAKGGQDFWNVGTGVPRFFCAR